MALVGHTFLAGHLSCPLQASTLTSANCMITSEIRPLKPYGLHRLASAETSCRRCTTSATSSGTGRSYTERAVIFLRYPAAATPGTFPVFFRKKTGHVLLKQFTAVITFQIINCHLTLHLPPIEEPEFHQVLSELVTSILM